LPEVVLVDFEIIGRQVDDLMPIFIQDHGIKPYLFDANSYLKAFFCISRLLAISLRQGPVLLAVRAYQQAKEEKCESSMQNTYARMICSFHIGSSPGENRIMRKPAVCVCLFDNSFAQTVQ
jgi:hypothetical protein